MSSGAQNAALDTLRWGDSLTVKLVSKGGFPGQFQPAATNKQLIAAHWKYPIAWNVLLIGQPNFPADETAQIIVTWSVTVGLGQSQTTLFYPLGPTRIPTGAGAAQTGLYQEGMYWGGPSLFSPFLGPYNTLVAQLDLSAQDIQINATIINGALATAGTDYMTLAAYVAPITEPHVLEEMSAELLAAQHQQVEQARFMDPGPYGPSEYAPGTGIAYPINPDPLKYSRR